MTTVEHAGFLAAIIEEPHDDFHRIVYADWLEENGEDERAEFIRAQLELAKMRAEALVELGRPGQHAGTPCLHRAGPGSKCHLCYDLRTTEWGYLDGSAAAHEWARDVLDALPAGTYIPDTVIFRRGFIAEVHGLTFDLWREHGPRLVRQHPLEVVKLAGDRVYQGHAEEWFTCMLPEWFLHFYNAKATPYRRTRGEAEKYLSDVLIWWAKAQELPQGEE